MRLTRRLPMQSISENSYGNRFEQLLRSSRRQQRHSSPRPIGRIPASLTRRASLSASLRMTASGRFCCRSRRLEEREGARRGCQILLLAVRPRGDGGCDALTNTRDAYATHAAAGGGGLATNLPRRRRFWAMAASVNSSCAPRGPRSRRRPSLRMRLRWANSISTRLRSRLLEGLGLAERTSRVAGIFIDAARDLARRLLRAASHLEWAHVAVELDRPIQQLLDIHDPASGGEHLACRARVDVARLVERKIFA